MKDEPDVLVLGQALEAPDGFALDGLVAATFSLDLAVALGIPLGAIRDGAFGTEASDGSRWAILEAIRTLGALSRLLRCGWDRGAGDSATADYAAPGRDRRASRRPQARVRPRSSQLPPEVPGCALRSQGRTPAATACVYEQKPDNRPVARRHDPVSKESTPDEFVDRRARTALPRLCDGFRSGPLRRGVPRRLSNSSSSSLAPWRGRSGGPPAGFSDVSLWPVGFGDHATPCARRMARLTIS